MDSIMYFLGLNYTRKCNYKCDLCSNDITPKEKLPITYNGVLWLSGHLRIHGKSTAHQCHPRNDAQASQTAK